jgi:hypothetical protein
MALGKAAYLNKLTTHFQKFRSVEVGEKLEGSTPPSIFVGSWNYPKVQVGPMLTPAQGDTSVLDTPEQWLGNKQLPDIVNFRLQLVRGKAEVAVKDVDNKFVAQLQEISLAKRSTDAEAHFKSKPKGVTFNMDHSPFGPSATIEKFQVDAVKWEHQFEKVYYDKDLKAAAAVKILYEKGALISQIQKAFSVGAMGLGKNRRLVPTRWSLTAVDSALANHLVDEIKVLPMLDTYQVYEFQALRNKFIVLLVPSVWQYEWTEAFLHVLGREEVIFSDWESPDGKKEYSPVGGCFYATKMSVAEHLLKIGKQAAVLVFREAYSGYIPTGVWLCRELTRRTFSTQPKEFSDLSSALSYVSSRLFLPFSRFETNSKLIKKLKSQRLLSQFI